MIYLLRWLVGLSIIGLLVLWPLDHDSWFQRFRWREVTEKLRPADQRKPESNQLTVTFKQNLDPKQTWTLRLKKQKSQDYVTLKALKGKLALKSKPNIKAGTLTLQYGKTVHHLWVNIPVVNTNGIYSALRAPVLLKKGDFWLPVDFLSRLTGQRPQWNDQQVMIPISDKKPIFEPYFFPKLSAKEIADYLAFLRMSKQGWKYTPQKEGPPFVWKSGKKAKFLSVRSPADGVVVRVERSVPAKKKGKPQTLSDQQRNPQVWVQYDKGVLIRFWHLQRIPAGLHPGSKLKKGSLLGASQTLKLDLQIYGRPLETLVPASKRGFVLKPLFQ
jgi:hypothetical protein